MPARSLTEPAVKRTPALPTSVSGPSRAPGAGPIGSPRTVAMPGPAPDATIRPLTKPTDFPRPAADTVTVTRLRAPGFRVRVDGKRFTFAPRRRAVSLMRAGVRPAFATVTVRLTANGAPAGCRGSARAEGSTRIRALGAVAAWSCPAPAQSVGPSLRAVPTSAAATSSGRAAG